VATTDVGVDLAVGVLLRRVKVRLAAGLVRRQVLHGEDGRLARAVGVVAALRQRQRQVRQRVEDDVGHQQVTGPVG